MDNPILSFNDTFTQFLILICNFSAKLILYSSLFKFKLNLTLCCSSDTGLIRSLVNFTDILRAAFFSDILYHKNANTKTKMHVRLSYEKALRKILFKLTPYLFKSFPDNAICIYLLKS